MTSSAERYRQHLRLQEDDGMTQLPGNLLRSGTRKMGRNRTQAPIDYGDGDGDGRAPWSRYAEPNQSRPFLGGSPQVPRRKNSLDNNKNCSRTRSAAPPPPPPAAEPKITRTDSDDEVLAFISQLNERQERHSDAVFSSSTRRRSFGRFIKGPRHRSPPKVDLDMWGDAPKTWDGTGDSNGVSDERPEGLAMNQRRSSTGTRGILPFARFDFGQLDRPQQPMGQGRRRSWLDQQEQDSDSPITRRRTSLNGTRPCMDGFDEAVAFDRPVLRPYRQLSSEDLCIGEETDEDLSNRSMLRTTANGGETSNRSNRSAFRSSDESNRSNRSAINNNNNADASNRSNRSAFDFSNRSHRTMDDISIRTFRTLDDFSNRSFRTNMDDMNNRSQHSLMNLSNHSLGQTTIEVSNRSFRSPIPQVVTEGNNEDESIASQHPSPVHEEEEEVSYRTAKEEASYRTAKDEASYRTAREEGSIRTAKEEVSIRTACSTQPQEPEDDSQRSGTLSKRKNHLNCRPEPWPVNKEVPSTVKAQQRIRPKVTKSKTWPDNLMLLLSIRQLGLKKSLSFNKDGNSSTTTRTSISSFEECDDSFSNKDLMVYEIDPATIDRTASNRSQRPKAGSPFLPNNKFHRAKLLTNETELQMLPTPPL